MPNRDVHLRVGAESGAAYATYHAWGQPGPYVWAEAAHLALDSLTPSSLPILC
jgi:hypothetical protein